MVTVITFRWAAPYLGRRKQARVGRRDCSFVELWRAESFALSQTRIARERSRATQSPTYTMYQSAQAAIRALGVTRGELFAGLYILVCANGLAAKMILSVHRLGWADAAGCVLHRHIVGSGRQDRWLRFGRPRGRDGSAIDYRSSNRRNELAGRDHA